MSSQAAIQRGHIAATLITVAMVLASCSSATRADAPAVIDIAETTSVELAPTLAPTAEPTVEPTASAVPTVAAPTAEPTATPPAEFVCSEGLCAHIDAVQVTGPELLIDWTAHGFTPSVESFHAHFYFDIFDATEVGTNFAQLGASRQGSWQVTDSQPFSTAASAVSMTAIPPGATQICVVPADPDHGVTSPENAECAQIPQPLLNE